MAKELFSSDPAFCPQCGAILPLPSTADTVSCKVCQHEQNTASELVAQDHARNYLVIFRVCVCAGFEGLKEYSCKYFTPRKEKVKLAEQGSGPLVSEWEG